MTEKPTTPEYVLACWRNRLNLAPDTPRLRTVMAFYTDAFARCIRLRGVLPEKRIANAHRDLIEIGGLSPQEADEWCYSLNERCERYAADLLAKDKAGWKSLWKYTKAQDAAGGVTATLEESAA